MNVIPNPTARGLVLGATGLSEDDEPIPHPDWPQAQTIELDGQIRRSRLTPPARPSAPRLGIWKHAAVTEMIDGSSAADQFSYEVVWNSGLPSFSSR